MFVKIVKLSDRLTRRALICVSPAVDGQRWWATAAMNGESRARRGFDRAPNMLLLLIDADLTVVWCDQATLDIVGFPRHEIIGSSGLKMFHSDDVEAVVSAVAEQSTHAAAFSASAGIRQRPFEV